MSGERDAVGTSTDAYGNKQVDAFFSRDASGNIIGLANLNGTMLPGIRSIVANAMRGRMSTTVGTTSTTYQTAVSVPGNVIAVRLVFGNTSNADVTIDGISFGSSQTASALGVASGVTASGTTVALTAGTFGGSAAGTMPANAASDRAANPTWYRSDWQQFAGAVRTDGGTRTIIMARAYLAGSGCPSAGAGGFRAFTEASHGQLFAVSYSNGGGNLLTGSLTGGPDPGQSPIVGIEYMTDSRVIRVAHFGDSIDEAGGGASVFDFGWGDTTAQLLNATGYPVIWENQGWSGQTSAEYFARWQTYIASCVAASQYPDIAIYKPNSPNDSASAAGNDAAKYRAVQFIDACRRYGIYPVLVTSTPINGISAPNDLLRKLINTWTRSMRTTHVGVIDMDLVTSDQGTPAAWLGTPYDTVHPSLTQINTMAARAVVDLTPILGSWR